MEIYLKHRDREEFVCLQRLSKDSYNVVDVFKESIELTLYEDESIDEGFKWFSKKTFYVNVNGTDTVNFTWKESSKDEFMQAYAEAQNSLLTFIQAINKK